jgi:hypothetical protein
VWVDVLPLQGRQFLACGLDVLCELEPDSGSTHGPAVAIDEQRVDFNKPLHFRQLTTAHNRVFRQVCSDLQVADSKSIRSKTRPPGNTLWSGSAR